MDEVPTQYRLHGRWYDLRQETDTLWSILENHDWLGNLTLTAAGWAAEGPGETNPDEHRTPDWKTTLDLFIAGER